MKFSIIFMMILCCPCLLFADSETPDKSNTITIFDNNMIHFFPDSSGKYDTDLVTAEDNGRIISTDIEIVKSEQPVKITAHLKIHPIPKDYTSVNDPWDRAGYISLVKDGKTDIELIKFITAYGGFTEYDVDVSHLAPLLNGDCKFKAFIDTWVTPGWKIDFSLSFETTENDINPNWANAVMFEQSYTKENYGEKGLEVEVNIPNDLKSVKLYYFVSGHCTDGTDADEFISKNNVIYIDGKSVYRYQPWRDDCKQFRAINPYTRRWSEGFWSSDFSRSGWCPGDYVLPLELDLSDHLTSGKHKIKFRIEDVRPKDENGHYGYWRISSFITGYKNILHKQNY